MTQITIPRSFPSQADPAAVVTGPGVRFTVLTARLIRLEYSRTDAFEDRASQAFWTRRQPIPTFKLTQTAAQIEIETAALHLRYRITAEGFTADTLSIAAQRERRDLALRRPGSPQPARHRAHARRRGRRNPAGAGPDVAHRLVGGG